MPFTIERFIEFRPYLYHLTAARNVNLIARRGELRCASAWLEGAGQVTTERRETAIEVCSHGDMVLLRDQKPLAVGAIDLEAGWSLERFVAHLNAHVFFWPGTANKPIQEGQNHFARYRFENPAILRVATQWLIDTNVELRFSRYNSGAPRCSHGRRSPRGAKTFVSEHEVDGSVSDVCEVVVVERCKLPASVEISTDGLATWRHLRLGGAD